MATSRKIAFVKTNCDSPWGGSEELWSQAALRLATAGHQVSASVLRWAPSARQLSALAQSGIGIHQRYQGPQRLKPESIRKALAAAARGAQANIFRIWLNRKRPDLVCISIGSPADDLTLISVCAKLEVPYAIIVQANTENVWPDDARAPILVNLFQKACRVFFVADRNRRLLETQLGISISNYDVVRNPFNVDYDVALKWPQDSGGIRVACVARLEPRAKGQDIVMNLMAREPWRSRPITLSLFGTGHMEQGLRRLGEHLNIRDRVRFEGQVEDVASVWATHHALVLPSRYEGLPLALVEAMLCARPAIATDVAGNAECVEDGATGFLAEAATEFHFELAMERAWQQRFRWQEMGTTPQNACGRSCPPIQQ